MREKTPLTNHSPGMRNFRSVFPKETRREREIEFKEFSAWRVFMRIGCPTALIEPCQIGLLGRAEKASAACGYPIDFQQTAQFEFLPQRRAQQRKEPGEAVAPLAEPGAEAQQEIQQQCRPYLPAHRVGRVAQKVGQLERLLDLLEEHFDLPAAP